MEILRNRLIPYNQHYRPQGYYSTAKEYAQSAGNNATNYQELYPETIVTQAIPESLNQASLQYSKSILHVTLPTVSILTIPQGRLYRHPFYGATVVSKDNKVIGEVSYHENMANGHRASVQANVLLKQRYFAPLKHYSGTLFNGLIGQNGGNYFHWLFDCLTKLHLLRKSGLFEQIDWFLLPTLSSKFHRSCIEMLGIPMEKVLDENDNPHVQADQVVTVHVERTYGTVHSWMLDFLRESFLPKVDNQAKKCPYIYISRNDSDRRNVTNESELVTMLEGYGFQCVIPGKLSFQEQVQLFASASIIVSPHGAALANTVFCQAGTTLIELFPDTFVHTLYCKLALQVGMHYEYFVSKHVSTNRVSKPIDHHITVNVDQIRKKVEEIVARTTQSEPNFSHKRKLMGNN